MGGKTIPQTLHFYLCMHYKKTRQQLSLHEVQYADNSRLIISDVSTALVNGYIASNCLRIDDNSTIIWMEHKESDKRF
jgi:hypothetical protein